MKKLLLIILTPLVFTACATTNTSPTPITAPTQNASFINAVALSQSLLETGGKLALQFAVNPADQKTIAGLLSGSGHVFESLETGKVPTVSDVQTALSAYFPTSNAKYAAYVEAGSTVWGTVRLWIINNTPQNNTTIAAAYALYALQHLAQTAYDVAAPFLG